VLKVVVSEGQQRGSLFAPIHWSGETASSARVGELVVPVNDPFSGQPEMKATPVSIAPVTFAYRGFVLARTPLAMPPDAWWSKVAVASGAGWLLASNEGPDAWRKHAQQMFAGAELAEYFDAPRGSYRVAAFAEGRLVGALFIGPAEAAPQWDAVKALFEAESLGDAQRRGLLSGKSTDGMADPGPVICACFGVGLNVIRGALESGAAGTVEDIGEALRAGTNCGSCLPELKKIVSQQAKQEKSHGRAAQNA
jgi:assimilatory nitrate reductase catalytic subunit